MIPTYTTTPLDSATFEIMVQIGGQDYRSLARIDPAKPAAAQLDDCAAAFAATLAAPVYPDVA